MTRSRRRRWRPQSERRAAAAIATRRRDDEWDRARPSRARAPPCVMSDDVRSRSPEVARYSLALRELKEERAFGHDLLSRLEAIRHLVLVTDARPEGDAAAIERAVRRGDMDEGKVLLVAQHRRRRYEETGM